MATGPMLRRGFPFLLLALLLDFSLPQAATAQEKGEGVIEGTVVSPDSVKPGDPVGAAWRSAVIPGWGQAYNHQLYKTPIIIGIIGGLTAMAIYNNNQFHTFNEAYLYGAYINEDPHPFPDYEEAYNMYPGVSTSTLKAERDHYRRNRNLLFIGAFLTYGLNILDAYVNGQLIGFDVGEDLSAAIVPVGIVPGAWFRLRF